jgi:hypothetical protein
MATFRSIFTIFSCIIIVGISSESLVQHDNHFDFLVYAQVWPISGCITWEERSDKNTCDIRSKYFGEYPLDHEGCMHAVSSR